MKRFFALLIANIKMTLRNKQSIFWMFIFPVLLMSLFGIIFGQGPSPSRLGVVNQDKTKLAVSLVKKLENTELLKQKVFKTKQEALKKLQAGKVDGVLIVKKGFTKKVQANLQKLPATPAVIELYYDPAANFSSQLILNTVANFLAVFEKRLQKQPPLFYLVKKTIRLASLRYIDYLLPGMIAMTLMNSALFGLGGTIVNYREKGVLRRLKVTPQPLTQFIAVQISNQLIFSVLRALLLIIVAVSFFKVKVFGSYFLLLLIVIVGSLTFVTIAFTVASFAKNREVADTLSNIISLPMMFLSGVFFPVDNAPNWIKPLIQILPLKYLADAFRAVMNKGEGLAAIQQQMLILSALTAVFFFISLKTWRWE